MGQLIIRWDNSPHWKNIKTFPHHKHEKNQILPSHRINIQDVIEEITKRLKSKLLMALKLSIKALTN